MFVRQSWLNDLLLCPQRARLGIVRKDMRAGSDATIMGTAVHHAIEEAIKAGGGNAESMTDDALGMFRTLQQSESWRETNIDPDKYEAYISSMCQAWHDTIMPEVEMGGDVEKSFAFPMGVHVKDWDVWCEGTMDYISPSGVVWDWKTAKRAYNARDKQSKAVQPTVYAAAAIKMGMASEWPVDFRYGVMLRQEKPKAQILSVHRNESHYNWLRHNVSPAVQYAIAVGMESDWIMNDESVLCSENWCSYWSICKGAFCSPADLTPSVDKPAEQSDTVTAG